MIGSKTLSPGARCILMDTDLANEIGKSAALLLQQIHYWIANERTAGKIHDNKKWIVNSYAQWSENIKMMSESTVKRAAQKLKKLNLIQIDQLFKTTGNRTNCITINYSQVEQFLSTLKRNIDSSPPHKAKTTPSSDQNDTVISEITNKDLINKSETKSINKYMHSEEEKLNRKSTVQDMLNIWNEIFPENHAKLTKELSRNLNFAYQNKFKSDIKFWKNYCLMIESSNYLTSDKFTLHLDWAIKFKTMNDIENGKYGCKNLIKEIENKKEIENLRIEIFQEIDELPESIECKNLRKKLLRQNVSDYSKFLRNIFLYQEGKLFFFVTEDQKQIQNIRRTYPIDLHGLGSLKKYEQRTNSRDKTINQEPQNDTDFELMVINSSNEPEIIKAKRRQLCEDFGIETYIKYFRILNLIDIGGDIYVKNKETGTIPLSDEIKNILHNSLCSKKDPIKLMLSYKYLENKTY